MKRVHKWQYNKDAHRLDGIVSDDFVLFQHPKAVELIRLR